MSKKQFKNNNYYNSKEITISVNPTDKIFLNSQEIQFKIP